MSPLLSVLLTTTFLLCGAAAVVVMMSRLGRPESEPNRRQLVLHRVFGWAFMAAFWILFGTMLSRFYAYWEEDPARVVLHYTTSFALLLVCCSRSPSHASIRGSRSTSSDSGSRCSSSPS